MITPDTWVPIRAADLVTRQVADRLAIRPIDVLRGRSFDSDAAATRAAVDLLEVLCHARPGPALVNVDVRSFSERFGLPLPGTGALPNADLHNFRFNFLTEELVELDAAWKAGDVVKYLDALVDLVYVAVGTALLAGLPFDAAWHAVQRANMTKERATGAGDPRNTRPHTLNVVKPAGWVGPDAGIAAALRAVGCQVS